MTVARGESVGIVGRTGAGKSTLVNLLSGLLTPTAGQIRVDGIDIQQARRAWQTQIGYVPQEFFLVDDTLRRNIGFRYRDGEIDDERIAQVVRLDEFLESIPAGVQTVVDERGVRLSG